MATVWKGAVSFGLVTVPVKAVVATREQRIRFVQLHEPDGQRIRMQRVCPEHGDVPYEEIIKGHPREGGHIPVTKEELAAVAPDKTDRIEVEDFVLLEDVDPVYFDRTYHLVPDGYGGKAYALLVQAMNETGRIAIGRVVMRQKEHLVALRTWEDGLVMETLYFADEVLPPEPVPDAPEPSAKERQMAKALVESMSTEFDPTAYEDEYRKQVEELLEAKAQGETVSISRKERPRVEDLSKALEASLEALRR